MGSWGVERRAADFCLSGQKAQGAQPPCDLMAPGQKARSAPDTGLCWEEIDALYNAEEQQADADFGFVAEYSDSSI